MVGVNQYKGKHELQPWSIFPDNFGGEDGQTIVKEEEVDERSLQLGWYRDKHRPY